MPKYLAGKNLKTGKTVWHELDDEGPDTAALAKQDLPNLLSFHRAVCGDHFLTTPRTELTDSFARCKACGIA